MSLWSVREARSQGYAVGSAIALGGKVTHMCNFWVLFGDLESWRVAGTLGV